MKKSFIFVVLLLSSIGLLDAQTWESLTTQNTSSTLPSEKVYALLFDPVETDLLWVATDQGLAYCKDDKWQQIPKEVAIAGKSILNLFFDSKNNLWISTEKSGLAMRSSNDKWTFYTDENGLSDNLVQDVAEDAKGGYWIANGASVSYLHDGKWTHHKPSTSPFTNMFTVAVNLANGEIWAGCESALFRCQNNVWNEVSEGAAFGSIQDILIQDGVVWIASQKGLQKYDGEKWTAFTTENGLPDNLLTTLNLDKDGKLWIGTDGSGVVQQDGTSWRVINSKQGLSSDDVFGIAFAQDGRPYLGTRVGGISYLDKQKVWHSISPNGLIGNNVRDILFTPEITWYATSAGISRLDKSGQWKNYTSKGHNLPSNNVRSLMRDKDGNIWFSLFDNGLASYTPDTDKWKFFAAKEGELPHKSVTGVAQSNDGHIWVTTWGGGVAEYDGSKWKTFTTKDGLSANALFSVSVAPDGALWFGSVAGVSIYHNGRFTTLDMANSKIPSNNIRQVCFAPDGAAYICTNAGLSIRQTNGSFEHFTQANGFISDLVNHVTFDSNGNKWISCWTNGFYLMTKDKQFLKVDDSRGFPATEANASRFSAGGDLQIGTNNGIAILKDPAKFVAIHTSSPNISQESEFVAYYNPTAGRIYLSSQAQSISLYTLSGQCVQRWSKASELSVDHLQPGLYLLSVDGKSHKLQIGR